MRFRDLLAKEEVKSADGLALSIGHHRGELWIDAYAGATVVATAIFGRGESGQFTCLQLHVEPDWRQRGVATLLCARAVELTGRRLCHPDLVSDEGRAFADALRSRRRDIARW